MTPVLDQVRAALASEPRLDLHRDQIARAEQQGLSAERILPTMGEIEIA